MRVDLIQALQSKQKQEGLTLTEMANRLGISQGYLSMLYQGQRTPGRRFLAGVVRAYPNLADQVTLFLSGNITTVEGVSP